VPLLTLGIPPTAATAVMLGALHGFGVKTGPLLLRDSPDFVWAIVASLLIGNVLLLILNVPLIRVWVKLLSVPTALLAPMILVISTVGVFSLSRNTTDLVLMVIFGVIGLLLRICDVPLAPAVLGLVLGPLMEEQWGRGLTTSQGDWSIFVSSPTAIVILVLALVALMLPVLLKALRRTRTAIARERVHK
jgi:putative tricarboxylic transport membrane protein